MVRLFNTAGLQVFERGWLSSNNVLFGGDASQEAVLIDTGYASHAAQTVALVRRALGERRLGRIVNTHLHSDHCGGNAALQSVYECAIAVPIGEAAKVDDWNEAALTYAATGQQCPRFRRTDVIAPGDALACGPLHWQALAAPGHDPESVVLYQPEVKLLISADALWENGFGVVFPELEGESGFDDVRATLDRLSSLSVKWVIPGHGKPFADFTGAIDRAHRRLDAYIADPRRHARHAAKVLIKFHLLEVQRQDVGELHAWLAATQYMQITYSRYFDALPFRVWSEELLRELAASSALGVSGDTVVNI